MSMHAPAEPHSAEPHWEQPNFDRPGSPPVVTGTVVPHPATQLQVPQPGPEETRLRQVQALLWPIALVACVISGHWLAFIVIALVVGAFLRRRLHELRRQRLTGTPALR